MLPGQDVDHFVEAVPLGLHLGARFADGHLVFLANRHARIFLAKFDQHQASLWLQRPLERAEKQLRLLQLVVDVHHQSEVECAVGQLRVRGGSEHCLDVVEAVRAQLLLDERKHFRLDVGRVHFSRRPHRRRQQHRVVAGSGADVGDRLPWFQLQRRNRFRRRFLLLTLLPIQPRGTFVSHDAGDAASGDGMCALGLPC